MDKKSFIAGAVAGKVATLLGLAAIAICIKKNVICPIEQKEKRIDDGRKRAARKRIAP